MEVVAGIGVGLWSGCSGIGLERWASAFYAPKGLDPDKWSEVFRKIVNELPNEENFAVQHCKVLCGVPQHRQPHPGVLANQMWLGAGRHFLHKWKLELT